MDRRYPSPGGLATTLRSGETIQLRDGLQGKGTFCPPVSDLRESDLRPKRSNLGHAYLEVAAVYADREAISSVVGN